MPELIRCDDLKSLMDSNEAYAVFDIRERGEYNEGQIYRASSLPRSQIEFSIAELVPVRDLPIIVYDDGGGRANLAAATINQLGYERVSVLAGGLPAWESAGYPTVTGVNVPSKEFGEKVHIQAKVPDISPEDLAARLARKDKIVVFDVRTPEEHRRFCIPGAFSVPGGDLILWAQELERNSDTTYLIHCAGRTRSVIGTQTLRRLGLSNVFSLRNGTMGWLLAGLELELNSGREAPTPSPSSRAAAEKLASRIADEEGIPSVPASELEELLKAKDHHVLYLVDVRSPGEFRQGYIAGSLGAPGGQAVQRADDFFPVKNAKIVFISDGEGRATMTAYWFKQMGFGNVAVLLGGIENWVRSGKNLTTQTPTADNVAVQEACATARTLQPLVVKKSIDAEPSLILHVGSSREFESAHLPRSLWVPRGWLEIKIGALCQNKSQPVILTCADGSQSVLAALSLHRLGYSHVSVLTGGVDGWKREGYPTEKGLEGNCAVEPKDVVVPASASGNKDAMVRYLDWEFALGEKFKGGTHGQP